MKAFIHRLEISVIEFEGFSLPSIKAAIENNPNLQVSVRDHQVIEVKDWTDSHPMNREQTPEEFDEIWLNLNKQNKLS